MDSSCFSPKLESQICQRKKVGSHDFVTLMRVTFLREICRSSHQRSSIIKVFLEISQNSQENTCARVSFLIQLQASACNFIKKETLAQVCSCEFCEISKNTFFTEYLRAAASKYDENYNSIALESLQKTVKITLI